MMKIYIIILILILSYMTLIKNKNKKIYAIAVFNDKIKGTVKFIEYPNNHVKIIINLTGLYKNHKHGFHIHEAGDLSDHCISMCAHFNPFNQDHGCPKSDIRHVGDLGNLITDENGNANYIMYDNMIKLSGYTQNIIGRGLIIHDKEDDCGKGGNLESLKTGNAGKRIACAVIGYAKENFKI